MMLNTRPVLSTRLKVLIGPNGSAWQGDTSPDKTGRRVQDIEVHDIRPEKYRAAIALAGAKTKRVLSDETTRRLQENMATVRAAKGIVQTPV